MIFLPKPCFFYTLGLEPVFFYITTLGMLRRHRSCAMMP